MLKEHKKTIVTIHENKTKKITCRYHERVV